MLSSLRNHLRIFAVVLRSGWWWELGAGGGAGEFEFLRGHVDGDVREEWGAEVAFAGVGEHGEDGGAFGGFGGDPEGSGEGGSGADADEDAFLLGQFPGSSAWLRRW